MLLSFGLILLTGMFLGHLCGRVRIPPLVGMMAAGILLGPYVLNLTDASVLNISSELRRIALLVILLRAGLKLKTDDLKRAGRPAFMMCFLPACFEILGIVIIGPKLFGLTTAEAALLGTVTAAVSPAVIVPRMIRLIDEGYGTKQGIPQMILAGASADDVFVIVLFSSFLSLVSGGSVNIRDLIGIPVSILTGAAGGFLAGMLFSYIVRKFRLQPLTGTLSLLAVSFLLSSLEEMIPFPFASLIGVMAAGMAVRRYIPDTAAVLAGQFDRIWKPAEIFLFFLVGASVSPQSALQAGPAVILLLAGSLLFRTAGVYISLLGAPFSGKEKFFCMLAYTPKATVQAAIGGIPFAMGLACGQTVLTVSAAAILLTAPLGAFGIDMTYKKFLHKQEQS